MSAMTPPVAVAAYAAAAISGTNPLRIAVTAMRFSIVAFVIPFIFVINPLVLTPIASLEAFGVCLATILACILIAIAAEIRWLGALSIPVRLSLIAAAILLSVPYVGWKFFGAVLGLGLLVYCFRDYQNFRYQ